MRCHCDSMLPFDNCCKPLLEENKPATTALSLMRSRYSAHVEKNASYIWQTYGEEQRQNLSIQTLQQNLNHITWQELEILKVIRGRKDDDYGEVEFVAHYIHNNAPLSLMEHSFFKKEHGSWKYIGQVEPKT
jgi:SEC-C motif domain protein